MTRAPAADPGNDSSSRDPNGSESHADATRGAQLQAQELRYDRLILVGALLCGSWILGPIGIVLLVVALRGHRRLRSQGSPLRPWVVTIIALFVLCDACQNFVFWSIDLLPAHDTVLGLTVWPGLFGRFFDGAYYLHYDSTALGGSPVAGEKALQFVSVLVVFPLRIAAAWGFLRMRRWGFRMVVTTTWMYIAVWIAYIMNVEMDFPARIGASQYGVVGFLIESIAFMGPFILLPYFWITDIRQWQ